MQIYVGNLPWTHALIFIYAPVDAYIGVSFIVLYMHEEIKKGSMIVLIM